MNFTKIKMRIYSIWDFIILHSKLLYHHFTIAQMLYKERFHFIKQQLKLLQNHLIKILMHNKDLSRYV